MMKKYEATTLEEACKEASSELSCSIEELEYNIIQYPSKGFLGFFAKKAIIVALNKKNIISAEDTSDKKTEDKKVESFEEIQKIEDKEEVVSTNVTQEEVNFTPVAEDNIEYESKKDEEKTLTTESEIVDSFFSETATKNYSNELQKKSITAPELEEEIKRLLSKSCFEIDTIEVDIEDNTAYVFIDGDDAALLIGKEGYRYNALSYLLFNWINANYGLYLKLEIAQFLASQQDMIKHQMQAVVEHVTREGWGKTRELNGILVQIALEHLRDTFPNKYVAIKRSKNGERYIVINEFNKK